MMIGRWQIFFSFFMPAVCTRRVCFSTTWCWLFAFSETSDKWQGGGVTLVFVAKTKIQKTHIFWHTQPFVCVSGGWQCRVFVEVYFFPFSLASFCPPRILNSHVKHPRNLHLQVDIRRRPWCRGGCVWGSYEGLQYFPLSSGKWLSLDGFLTENIEDVVVCSCIHARDLHSSQTCFEFSFFFSLSLSSCWYTAHFRSSVCQPVGHG
jgi:hypothetical protein